MKRERKQRKSKYYLFRFDDSKDAARVTRDNFEKKRPRGASVAASNKRRAAEKRISGVPAEKKTRGKKLTCTCGQCKKCRHREVDQRSKRRLKGKPVKEPSDQELDEIMDAYFVRRGWD